MTPENTADQQNLTTLNALLRAVRESKGISQRELARLRNTHPTSQSDIERATNMSWSTANEIAAALGGHLSVTYVDEDSVLTLTAETKVRLAAAVGSDGWAPVVAEQLANALDVPSQAKAPLALHLRAAVRNAWVFASEVLHSMEERGEAPTYWQRDKAYMGGIAEAWAALMRADVRLALVGRDMSVEDLDAEALPAAISAETLIAMIRVGPRHLLGDGSEEDFAEWDAYFESGEPHRELIGTLAEQFEQDDNWRLQMFEQAGWGRLPVRSNRREAHRDD